MISLGLWTKSRAPLWLTVKEQVYLSIESKWNILPLV